MNYKELLILRLSHLIEWKNEKEMFVPNNFTGGSLTNTCEFLGNGRYIIRSYYNIKLYANKLYAKKEYKNNLLNGLSLGWHENGQRRCRVEFRDGRKGSTVHYYRNGRPEWKHQYNKYGNLQGIERWWHEDGQPKSIKEWENGKLIREIL